MALDPTSPHQPHRDISLCTSECGDDKRSLPSSRDSFQDGNSPTVPDEDLDSVGEEEIATNNLQNVTPDDYSWVSPEDMAKLKTMSDESTFRGSTIPCSRLHQHQYQHQNHIKRLPKGCKPIRLVGEGAANAVFEIKIPPRSKSAIEFKGLLLRIAKVPCLGHPSRYNYLLQQSFFQKAIKPILGDFTVHQELVILHKTDIVQELNTHLQNVNHLRKPKFRDSYIGQTDWGLLVEDMRPNPNECVLVEFKPKWLSQSPSAPSTAIRCRQCALELRHFVTNPRTYRLLPDQRHCPLAIGNTAVPPQVCSVFRIAPQLASTVTGVDYEEALRRVSLHPVLQELKVQQSLNDTLGPLQASQNDPYFALAMTIRDCTCFAHIPRHPGPENYAPLKIRLGDLDWKDPSVKFDHWRGTEAELVTGGYYTAEWILCDGVFYHPPTLCLLEWCSGKRDTKPDVLSVVDDSSPINTVTSKELPQGSTYSAHSLDVAALKSQLQDYKLEPPGTSPLRTRNPYRSKP